MKYLVAVLITMICVKTSFAQVEKSTEEFYMPLEFKKAYEKGTRIKSGKVSEKYWQNKAKYIIDASIDPETRLLKGKASITYYNNSPDSLKFIVVQAYHDYLKPYAKRKFYYPPEFLPQEEHEGFIMDSFAIADEEIDLRDNQRVRYEGTNYSIFLKNPLLSQDSLKISVDWHYAIPEDYSRSGAIDSTSMFIAYWYPEIAVKDDIDGWDTSIYDTSTEFYHDFSDYEVTINLPDNFVVWASVAPENPEEVYTPQTRERLEKARKSSSAIKIFTEADFKKESSSRTTWKYKAKNFPDFSFALSDHFLWEARTHQHEKRNVFIQVAYVPHDEFFIYALPAMNQALNIFHNTFPKYAFPYDYFTTFTGMKNQAMEFPGMMNTTYYSKEMVEKYKSRKIDPEQIMRGFLGMSVHEMGHMYFPFLMGLNEKNYAWMDEGFANFLDSFLTKFGPDQKADNVSLASISRTPLMVTSREHEGSWVNSYEFGSIFYYSLYDLLGRESFMNALHAFMEEWQYKHPTPYDMFYTFNRETKKDITWFINDWLFDWGYIDLGITSVKGQEIKIRNNGGKAVSFKIISTSENGLVKTDLISPEVWKDSSVYIHQSPFKDELTEVNLEVAIYGDAVFGNNQWEKGD